MEPLATEPLVVLASASPIVGALLGEKRIGVCHSATGYASGPRRMSAPTRGIERHARSLTDPLFVAGQALRFEGRRHAAKGPAGCAARGTPRRRPTRRRAILLRPAE